VRLRRIAAGAAILVLIPAFVSFASMATRPSNTALGIRTVEWLRENGAGEIVADVESVYYSLTAPSKGGPALRALPSVGFAAHPNAGAARSDIGRPPDVRPMLHPALRGEGVWRATRPGFQGPPPVFITTIRDQPEYPRVVAGLAWIDPHRTSVVLYPGREEPAVELPSRGPLEVPDALRPRLLATFNSAFKLTDSGGGFIYHGHEYAPMRDGGATFVGYRNGAVNVVAWDHGSAVPHDVWYARQNLDLTVNQGRLAPNIENSSAWGATIGNAVLTWRSAAGITAHGDLLYAAGEDQSAGSLARALIRAGAVRAMSLDINPYWTSFISYGSPGARAPRNLLPNMERSPYRYLEPDDRDFFAVYER